MGALNILAKILLAFIFVLSFVSFSMALVVTNTALNPDFAADIVSRFDFTGITNAMLENTGASIKIPDEIAPLIQNDTRLLVFDLAGPQVKTICDYFLGNASDFSVSIKLADAREKIRSIALRALDELAAQKKTLDAQKLRQRFESAWPQIARQIPDEITLSSADLSRDEGTVQAVASVRLAARIVWTALIASAIALGVSAVLFFIVSRNLKTGLRSLGLLVFIPALILFSLALIAPFVAAAPAQYAAGFSPFVTPQFITTALTRVAEVMQLVTGIGMAAGSLLFGVSFFFRSRLPASFAETDSGKTDQGRDPDSQEG